MARYTTANTLRDTKEKRYLSTTLIPPMPISTSDTYIVVTTPERLDKLANTFYGDARLWWIIAAANGLGKGTIIVPSDSRLRIPSAANVQQVINDTNNLR